MVSIARVQSLHFQELLLQGYLCLSAEKLLKSFSDRLKALLQLLHFLAYTLQLGQ